MKIIEDFFLQKGIYAWNVLPEEAIRLIHSVTGNTPLPNRPLDDTTGIAVLLPYRIFPNLQECPCTFFINTSFDVSNKDDCLRVCLQAHLQECPQSTQSKTKGLSIYNEHENGTQNLSDISNVNTNFLQLQIGSFAAYNYYHFLVRILKELAFKIRSYYGWQKSDIRISVNSQLPEKDCARLAGLGWIGKSGLLINQDYGSAVIIGVMLFPKNNDFRIQHARAQLPSCGDCAACIEACPTHALDNGFNKELCLQYWMSTGAMPEHLKPKRGIRLYGCDNCTIECPYTKKAQQQAHNTLSGTNVLHTNNEDQLVEKATLSTCEGFKIKQQENNGHMLGICLTEKLLEISQEKQQGHSSSFENMNIYDFLESQMTAEEKKPGRYIVVNKFTRVSPFELKNFFKGTALGLSWIPINDFIEYIQYLQNLGKMEKH